MESKLDILDLDDNSDEQELQELKNNFIEQIENFKNEILKLYEKHKYLLMLDVLIMEVKSEYVTLKNLKIYCSILRDLVREFRLNPYIEYRIGNLEDKVEKIAGAQIKSIEKNDEYIIIGLNVFYAILFVFLFIAVSVALSFSGLIGLATFGVGIGIILAIRGGYEFICMLKKWYRNRNLYKIEQKSQEIKEKVQKKSKQENQMQSNATLITVEQSLFLYIKNKLLLLVENYSAISTKINEICLKKSNDLRFDESKDEINIEKITKVERKDDLIKFSKDMLNIVESKVSELKKFKREKFVKYNNFDMPFQDFLKNLKQLEEISETLKKIHNKFGDVTCKNAQINVNNELKPQWQETSIDYLHE